MKNSELQTLVNEELESLYSFMDEELKIPDSFSSQDCLCFFLAHVAEAQIDGREITENEKEEAKTYNATFRKLCRSVPDVPVLSLQVTSLALGALAALHDIDGKFIKNNESEVIQTLMTVSYARGMAVSIVEYRPDLTEIERKKMLSKAGLMGARSRHRLTAELKEWALKRAAAMRGAHKDVASKLAAQLPTHLADASKDPERLIYDALRALAKSN